MNSISLLISDFLDRELADEDVARLAGLLKADPAAVDRFVLTSFVHSQMLDWIGPHGGQDLVAATDFVRQVGDAAAIDDVLVSPRASTDGVYSSSSRRRSWLWSIATLAATLLIAATIASLGYIVAARPVIVAQLNQATGCQWQVPATEMSDGMLLESGQKLNLVKGGALIKFANGAQIWLEGPTSLRLDSVSRVYLHGGRVAVKVPTQARGFSVTSSLATFVDLGTEFTLALNAENSFDLHVFEGLVEVRLDKRFGDAAHQPLRVTEVRAVHFDVASGDVETLHFEVGKQMPF